MKAALGCLIVSFVILSSIFVHAETLDLFYDSNGGQYMAIMSSGDVNDFGYNYIINYGRVVMEQQRNMSGTLWIPNIPDNVTAIAKSKELVAKGYRVIVSGTFSHGNAMSYCATLYPNVTFIQYSSAKSTLPNLSSVSWLNSEFWFAIGVVAGTISLNNKVGFIHPGLTAGSVQSINAFYSGVKYANASNEVYTMFTGAYIAVDRANGASDVLVNQKGVGLLTGQQDDLTVPIYAMNAGLLAIGVTGYSLRQLYGEQVAVSFVRDWTPSLSAVSVGVNGTVYHGDITGSFKNNGQDTDTPSHLVTPQQWAVIQDALALIRGPKTTLYLCGEWFSEWGLNSQGCLPNSTAFNGQLYPGVNNLGFYNVPLTDKPFPHGTRTGIIIAAAILLVIPVALVVFVIVFRKLHEIQAGSPVFFIIMLTGTILIYVGVIIWPLDPSEANCYARVWLPSLGATIAISALITKNLRIFLLFFNPFRFRGEKLHLKNYLPIVLMFVAMDVIILAVYTKKGPDGVTIQQGIDGLSTYETRHICSTTHEGNSIIYAILVFHMFQLILGCIISFLLRNVTEKEFNERKAVGMAIYVTSFCLIIVALLLGATDVSNEQLVLFTSIALLLCTTGVLIIVFGSHLINIFVGEVDPMSFTTKVVKTATTATTMMKSSKSSDGDSAVSSVANINPLP